MPPKPRDTRRYRSATIRRPRARVANASPGASGIDRLQQVAAIVAPTTVVTAMLGYFGYLATRARFEYFGVYLDLVNLSTPDLLLYGSEVVFVPVTLAALAVLTASGLRLAGQWLILDERWSAISGWVATVCALGGVLLLIRAVNGILAPDAYRSAPTVVTPLSLGLGAVLVRWGFAHLGTRFLGAGNEFLKARNDRSGWTPAPGLVAAGRVATATLVVAGLFWIGNSFAALYGTGRAMDDAAQLPRRPEIIVDTTEPLDPPPGITETSLPAGAGKFRHRYRGFRLLVESGGRMFLVPAVWTEGVSRALVLEYGDGVRIQLAA